MLHVEALLFADDAVRVAERDGMTVVVATGEADIATTQALAACIDAALASQPPHLIIDLGGVTFLGMSAVTVIAVNARDLAPERRVILRRPRDFIREVLRIVRMDEVCLITN